MGDLPDNDLLEFEIYQRNYMTKTPEDYIDKDLPNDDNIRLAVCKFCGSCCKYKYIGDFLISVFDTDPRTYCLQCRSVR